MFGLFKRPLLCERCGKNLDEEKFKPPSPFYPEKAYAAFFREFDDELNSKIYTRMLIDLPKTKLDLTFEIEIDNNDWGYIRYMGLYDQITDGKALWFCPFSTPLRPHKSDTLRINIPDYVLMDKTNWRLE